MARVLVVEDDAAINDVVATRLARDGHEVTQAFSGSEARLLLGEKNCAFDVVVCDLMLPGVTGEELVGLIRAHDAATPIIVISARATAADKIGLLGLGADDYLTKPFDLDELAARVEVQLRHRGVASEPAGLLHHRRWALDAEARTLTVPRWPCTSPTSAPSCAPPELTTTSRPSGAWASSWREARVRQKPRS